jgi:hypothetical protein
MKGIGSQKAACQDAPAHTAVSSRRELGPAAESPDGQCAPHGHVDSFIRRLERDRWFYTPCLGRKEFVPGYVGPFRTGTAHCTTKNSALPTLLGMVFN